MGLCLGELLERLPTVPSNSRGSLSCLGYLGFVHSLRNSWLNITTQLNLILDKPD